MKLHVGKIRSDGTWHGTCDAALCWCQDFYRPGKLQEPPPEIVKVEPIITCQEADVLETSAKLYNEFCNLPGAGEHPMDREEFIVHLHALQRIIMARAVRRACPDFFNGIRA